MGGLLAKLVFKNGKEKIITAQESFFTMQAKDIKG